MMKNCYFFSLPLILFLHFIVALQAQVPEFVWVQQAGGTEPDAASRIEVDANGNSYITGIFRGTAHFGDISLTSRGNTDVFIAKYDAAGNVLWAKQAGGEDIDSGKNIAVDREDNSYITGDFIGNATFDTITLIGHSNYDIYIVKYDPLGNVVWAKQSSGPGLEAGRGITVDDNGNCFVTGYFDGNAVFDSVQLTSNGSFDVFVAKYDPYGNFLWANRAGGNSEEFGRNVGVDTNGNCYITGTFKGVAGFGNTFLTSSGLEDIFIVSYDASGNARWANKAGGNQRDAGNGIALDADGNSFITGEFQGNVTFDSIMLSSMGSFPDIFIAKYDASGHVVWAKSAGGNANDFGKNIAIDGTGNSYITGEFESNASFGSTTLKSSGGVDVLVASFDASGNVLWAKRAGGSMEERAAGVATDGNGNIYISGYFLGEASFGNTTITSSGVSDIYNAKLSATTGIPNSTGFNISTWPNPFTNSITVNLATNDHATVTLTDLAGRTLDKQDVVPESGIAITTLTTGHWLASGAYLL